MTHLIIDSPVGPLTLAANTSGLTGVWFRDHRYPPSAETLGERVVTGEHPLLDRAATQLGQYLAGERVDFDLPLDPAGTHKQRAIWEQLRLIPRGEVTTYGALAAAVGSPRGAQAAGQAVGHNPLSIVVPCHRVVGANGAMTGYAGGLERKRFLLELEGNRLIINPPHDVGTLRERLRAAAERQGTWGKVPHAGDGWDARAENFRA